MYPLEVGVRESGTSLCKMAIKKVLLFDIVRVFLDFIVFLLFFSLDIMITYY
jgi:hypothetical protein